MDIHSNNTQSSSCSASGLFQLDALLPCILNNLNELRNVLLNLQNQGSQKFDPFIKYFDGGLHVETKCCFCHLPSKNYFDSSQIKAANLPKALCGKEADDDNCHNERINCTQKSDDKEAVSDFEGPQKPLNMEAECSTPTPAGALDEWHMDISIPPLASGKEIAVITEKQELANTMRENIEVKDRRHHLHSYKRCFTGKDALTWLLQTGKAATVNDAQQLGTSMIVLGMVKALDKVGSMEMEATDLSFYRFNKDQREIDLAESRRASSHTPDVINSSRKSSMFSSFNRSRRNSVRRLSNNSILFKLRRRSSNLNRIMHTSVESPVNKSPVSETSQESNHLQRVSDFDEESRSTEASSLEEDQNASEQESYSNSKADLLEETPSRSISKSGQQSEVRRRNKKTFINFLKSHQNELDDKLEGLEEKFSLNSPLIPTPHSETKDIWKVPFEESSENKSSLEQSHQGVLPSSFLTGSSGDWKNKFQSPSVRSGEWKNKFQSPSVRRKSNSLRLTSRKYFRSRAEKLWKQGSAEQMTVEQMQLYDMAQTLDTNCANTWSEESQSTNLHKAPRGSQASTGVGERSPSAKYRIAEEQNRFEQIDDFVRNAHPDLRTWRRKSISKPAIKSKFTQRAAKFLPSRKQRIILNNDEFSVVKQKVRRRNSLKLPRKVRAASKSSQLTKRQHTWNSFNHVTMHPPVNDSNKDNKASPDGRHLSNGWDHVVGDAQSVMNAIQRISDTTTETRNRIESHNTTETVLNNRTPSRLSHCRSTWRQDDVSEGDEEGNDSATLDRAEEDGSVIKELQKEGTAQTFALTEKTDDNSPKKEFSNSHRNQRMGTVYLNDIQSQFEKLTRSSAAQSSRTRCLVISQDNAFRENWSLLVILATVYMIAMVPVQLAFGTGSTASFSNLAFVLDIAFLLDIVLNFFTSYRDVNTKEEISSLSLISRNYLKGFFLTDLLGSIPEILVQKLASSATLGKYIGFIRLLRALKIFRLVSANQALKKFELRLNTPSVYRMCKISVTFLVILHLVACLFWIISCGGYFFVPNFSEVCNEEGDFQLNYSHSLHYSMATITGNAIGAASSTAEYCFEAWCLLVSIIINATIIGSASSILSSLDSLKTLKKRQIDALTEYLHTHKINRSLQKRIKSYYEYLWDIGQSEHNDRVIQALPPKLKLELNLTLKQNLVNQCPLLKILPPKGVLYLVQHLVPVIVMPNEIVSKQGDSATCMYFLSRGIMDIYREECKEEIYLVSLHEGSFFGDIEMVKGANSRRWCTVVSSCFSELQMLEYAEFQYLSKSHSEFSYLMKHLSYAEYFKLQRMLAQKKTSLQNQHNLPSLQKIKSFGSFSQGTTAKRSSTSMNYPLEPGINARSNRGSDLFVGAVKTTLKLKRATRKVLASDVSPDRHRQKQRYTNSLSRNNSSHGNVVESVLDHSFYEMSHSVANDLLKSKENSQRKT